MIDDFPPTAQDIAVRDKLTKAIEQQLTIYNSLMDKEVTSFNQAFKEKALDYLVQ